MGYCKEKRDLWRSQLVVSIIGLRTKQQYWCRWNEDLFYTTPDAAFVLHERFCLTHSCCELLTNSWKPQFHALAISPTSHMDKNGQAPSLLPAAFQMCSRRVDKQFVNAHRNSLLRPFLPRKPRHYFPRLNSFFELLFLAASFFRWKTEGEAPRSFLLGHCHDCKLWNNVLSLAVVVISCPPYKLRFSYSLVCSVKQLFQTVCPSRRNSLSKCMGI